jgi:hypothetical protein
VTLVYIAIGLGLLVLWIAVTRHVIAALRNPHARLDKTVSDPILLAEFRSDGDARDDLQSASR